MTRNAHEEARELVALRGTEELSEAQQSWLDAHLEQCAACRDYAEAAGGVIGALRSLPMAADARLVRATQMRVRFHASRLRETRERMWLLGVACVGVGFSAALSAPVLWRLFAWMGEWAGIARPLWEAGFIFFWAAPMLVVSLLLLAGGTRLANAGKHTRQQNR